MKTQQITLSYGLHTLKKADEELILEGVLHMDYEDQEENPHQPIMNIDIPIRFQLNSELQGVLQLADDEPEQQLQNKLDSLQRLKEITEQHIHEAEGRLKELKEPSDSDSTNNAVDIDSMKF